MTSETIRYIGFRVDEGECKGVSQACKARCFSQQGDPTPEAPTYLLRSILELIARAGTKAVNFMGGEPTSRVDLPELTAYAKSLGLQVILSTNTLLLTREMLNELTPTIDWLSISLDADDQRMDDALRGKGHFESVQKTLRWISETEHHFRVKINTQVTAVNSRDIKYIPDHFNGQVSVWKLLQWTPRADAMKAMDTYAIPKPVYFQIVEELRQMHPQVNIVDRPYPEPVADTVIVRPDGRVLVNDKENDYTPAGNILIDGSQAIYNAVRINAGLPPENNYEFIQSYPVK